ncbi:MAG: TolC family protein [Mucilaginibacter polytrichastri]|nr:TolC family protein [Mucilaginibacter polytrichastri]
MATRLSAQTDTVRLGLQETEKRFLEKNLSVVAAKYNIESSKALVAQAKLWDNPTLVTDQNLYAQRKFFSHANDTGQVFIQLNQLFKTAGKRGKQVQMAKDNASIQQSQFDELMRNLHYNLVLDYYQLAVLQGQSGVYDKELNVTQGLIRGMDGQYKAGNISLKDLMRIKALQYGLSSDDLELQRQLTDVQVELKTLLQLEPGQVLIAEDPEVKENKTVQELPADSALIRLAQNRPDVSVSRFNAQYAADNLRYQKALAVPDLTVGVEYDRINSYVPHYFGLALSLPLPLWNLNRGNIKSAGFDQKAQEASLRETQYRAGAEVVAAVQRYHLTRKLYEDTHNDFDQNYDRLFNGMLKSYRQKEVGLVEFVDFFDAYRETRLKLLQQRFDVHKAAADINFTAGKNVINP